ncbi:small subunit ribosomal protein S9 [Actinomycetospora cinnamomea]|uniref:Small ribosomal subunit protein uS9 n=1 Tax=Actinomycetospora cinnamomea TaxID=663609 RepID=A0A2U1F6S2_9PSEU|nr:30S ribosomal protein S9 [Actinomycetospora cinnamomea]PVZ07869.1 small subunit ribosomal protein S9 [Actinomycetospora cinnamomea]
MTSPDDQPDLPAEDAAQTLAEAADLPEGAVGGTPTAATDDLGADDLGADADTDADADADTDVFGEAPVAPVFASIDRPIQTVGRRKEAVVRVRLVAGSGRIVCNDKAFEEYFPNKVHQQLIREPLVTTERTEQFDVFATLTGGGTSGQAGALRLALARALTEVDPDDRPGLKKAGFLTRDARAKERKKYGLKKARKAPQYSKR